MKEERDGRESVVRVNRQASQPASESTVKRVNRQQQKQTRFGRRKVREKEEKMWKGGAVATVENLLYLFALSC